MKITKPLDNILNTEIRTRILRFLCRTGAEWNGRQIAKEIGVTPKSAHMALSALEGERVLLLRNMGKTHIYTLNEKNYIVSDLLKPLFLKEDMALNKITGIIRRNLFASKIGDSVLSVSLFGSVNVRRDHSASDIDLAVIIRDIRAKSKVEKLFEKIDRKVSEKFGNTISPYINTKAEFRAKYGEKLEIVKNMLKSNTLIYGARLERML